GCVLTPKSRPVPRSVLAMRSIVERVARGSHFGGGASWNSGTITASTAPTCDGRTARNFISAGPLFLGRACAGALGRGRDRARGYGRRRSGASGRDRRGTAGAGGRACGSTR